MRVLVTRPAREAAATAAALVAMGIEAVVEPLLRVVVDPGAAIDVTGLQAIAVTSANAVGALAEHPALGDLLALPVYAVGDTTADAATALGFATVCSADGAADDVAAAVVAALRPGDGAILYPVGRDRSGDLAASLADAGFVVRLVEVYRTVASAGLSESVADTLRHGEVDAFLVLSRKTAEILVCHLTDCGILASSRTVAIHVISENAAEPLRRAGFGQIVVAPRPSVESLLSTLLSTLRLTPGFG